MERPMALADYSDRSELDRKILRDETAESHMRRSILDQLDIIPKLHFVGRVLWQDPRARLVHVLQPSEAGGPGILMGYSLVSEWINGLSVEHRHFMKGTKTRVYGLSVGTYQTCVTVQFVWHSLKPRIEIINQNITPSFDPKTHQRINMTQDVCQRGLAALVDYSIEHMAETSVLHPGAVEFNPNHSGASMFLTKALFDNSVDRKQTGLLPWQMNLRNAGLISNIPILREKGDLSPTEIEQAIGDMRGHHNRYWGPIRNWLRGKEKKYLDF